MIRAPVADSLRGWIEASVHSMPRTFAYVRVSIVGQTVENHICEIAEAGFAVKSRRVAAETVLGSKAIAIWQELGRLLDRLETADVLVVTRLDPPGLTVAVDEAFRKVGVT